MAKKAPEANLTETLGEMGIQDADDLGPGRGLDMGELARHLNSPEPDTTQEDMEDAVRDSQYEQMGETPEQPHIRLQPAAAPAEPEPVDNLAKIQADLAEAQAESKRMKEQYARESEKWGNERKRYAEQKARQEQGVFGGYVPPPNAYAPPAQSGVYDPRILGDTDPNAPLTAGQTAALMHSMAAAFGQQLSAREQSVIEAAREMRNYDLTSNEEADLIERHGWLATLDRASQIKAMRDLVAPLRAASQPAAATPPIKPQGVNMEALARARHLTATTFIEPSSRTSTQEQAAATGIDSALSKKIAEYKEAMKLRPGMPGDERGQYGENLKAERLIKEINVLQRRRA
jgi:hypothetical protein